MEWEKESSDYRLTKEKIDTLNTLSEYVGTKIKSLEQQRVVVEKANREAGKLNVLSLTKRVNAVRGSLRLRSGQAISSP